jgi:transposase-like protein
MTELNPFKWRHFQADLILLCVRWYLRYALSYRDLEEIMLERGYTSITQPSIAGFSPMLQNWRSDADPI